MPSLPASKFQIRKKKLTIYWQFQTENNTIDFVIKVRNMYGNYFGIGLNISKYNSDVIMMYMYQNKLYLLDMFFDETHHYP